MNKKGDEVMDYEQSYLLHLICVCVALPLLLIYLTADFTVFGVIGAVVVVFDVIQTTIFYRCPKCGHQLSTRWTKYAFCPQCGCRL